MGSAWALGTAFRREELEEGVKSLDSFNSVAHGGGMKLLDTGRGRYPLQSGPVVSERSDKRLGSKLAQSVMGNGPDVLPPRLESDAPLGCLLPSGNAPAAAYLLRPSL